MASANTTICLFKIAKICFNYNTKLLRTMLLKISAVLLLLTIQFSPPVVQSFEEIRKFSVRDEGFVTCLGICRCNSATGHVDCSNLGLKAVPTSIPDDVITLDLSGNVITKIREEDFMKLRNLKNLFLRSNRIDSIHERSLIKLTSLEMLDFGYNRLAAWSGNITAPIAQSLTFLDLSGNQIEKLTASMFNTFMPKLKELYLEENGMKTIEIRSFQNLPNLKILSLKVNVLKEFNLDGLEKLEKLFLDRNFFSYFPEPTSFGPAQKSLKFLSFSGHQRVSSLAPLELPLLNHLNVSNCNLNYIDNFTFVGTPRLNELDISYNAISIFGTEAFSGLSVLKKLSISRNPLVFLPYRALSDVGETLEELNADYLDLSRIPAANNEVGSSFLTNLTILSLQNNRIVSIDAKSFFRNLKSLVMLRLSSTLLREVPTMAIAHLLSLEELEFERNRITNLTASSFPNLTLLRRLSLDGSLFLNQIENGTFSKLRKNLMTISITGSTLSSIDKEAFAGLDRLSQLQLNNNKLELAYAEWFDEKRLTVLMMSGNLWSCDCKIKLFREWILTENYMSIPTKDLLTCHYPRLLRGIPISDVAENLLTCETPKCPAVCVCRSESDKIVGADCSGEELDRFPLLPSSLTMLNMDRNHVTSLNIDTLSPFPFIREILLAANSISVVKEFAFAMTPELNSLDLSSNFIDELSNKALKNLTALQQLRLHDNQIDDISSSIFTELQSLLILDLSNNFISSMVEESFIGLKNLQTLILGGNLIEHVGAGVFLPLSNIQVIYLDHNRINSLDGASFSALHALQVLDLSSNSFDILNSSFISSQSLNYLKLESAGISKISARAFARLQSLTTLRMSNNRIENVADDAFHMEPGNELTESPLVSVDFNSNQLQQFPIESFKALVNLQALYLSDNPMRDLPIYQEANVCFLPNLQTLHLAKNDITEILNTSIFRHFSTLKTLVLNEVKLSRIPSSLFSILPNLSFLSLDNNQIENISRSDFSWPHNLTHLSLRFNSFLKRISKDAFSNLANLSELRLEKGALRHIDPDAFFNLKHLNLLDLSKNQLTTPNSGWFSTLSSNRLVSVALHDNPWACDCASLPYQQWLLHGADGLTPYSLSVVCDDPFYLKGTTIEDAAILCSETSTSFEELATTLKQTTAGSRELQPLQFYAVTIISCITFTLQHYYYYL